MEAPVPCAVRTALGRTDIQSRCPQSPDTVRGRDDHSPAYTAESALERAARLARERGGYTVRLDSLRAAQARNHVRTQYEKDSRGHDCDDPDLHGLRHGEHEHHIPPFTAG